MAIEHAGVRVVRKPWGTTDLRPWSGRHHDGAAVHDAGWQMMQTGRRFTGGIHTPHAGSVTSYLMGRKTDLPPFVVLPQLMAQYAELFASRQRAELEAEASYAAD